MIILKKNKKLKDIYQNKINKLILENEKLKTRIKYNK